MAAPLPYLELDGLEVANGARTLDYIRNSQGYGRHFSFVPGCMCAAMYRAADMETFVSPTADPAPWYSSAWPESADFLGLLITDLDGFDTEISRSVTQRVGGIGGALLGPEHLQGRTWRVRGYLIANDCAGLEYGRRWVASQLAASNCDTCLTRTLRVWDHCPDPDDGSNDEQGEWFAYDVGLTDGPRETENDGLDRCCDAVEFEFTLTAQNPYLYKRPDPCVGGESGVDLNPTFSSPANISGADLVLDNFNRADSLNLGSKWAGPIFSGEPTLQIVSNTVKQPGTAVSDNYWASPFADGNMLAAGTISSVGANGDVAYVFARVQSPNNASTTDGYCVDLTRVAGVDTIRLRAIVNNSFSTIAGPTNHEAAAGDRLAIVCNGTTIEGWLKPAGGLWLMILSAVDATVPAAAASYGGLRIEGTGTLAMDDFTAGPWDCGGMDFCAWINNSPSPVCCTFTEPAAFGIVGAIVTINAGDGDVNDVTISSYPYCPFVLDEFDGSGALLTPWSRDGANTIVQTAGQGVPGSGLGVTYRYRYADRARTNSRVVAKYTPAGTGVNAIFGLTLRADTGGVDTLLYGRINATTAQIAKRIAGVETTLVTGGFTPVVSTSYWLAFAIIGDDLTLEVFDQDPLYGVGDATTAVTPITTLTYTLTAAELAQFVSGHDGFRWAPTVDSGAMDDFKIYDLDVVASTSMTISTIPAGSSLTINSSTHTIVLTDADGNETDGSNLIVLEDDRAVEWVEASACEPGACICVQLDHFCGADDTATVMIETQERAR